MQKLMEALLENMGHESGSLMKKRPTRESDSLHTLWGVYGRGGRIQTCRGNCLCHRFTPSLNIHRRCQPYSTKEQREDAAAILNLLTTRFVQFQDWRELVRPDEHDDAEALIKDMLQSLKTKTELLLCLQLMRISILHQLCISIRTAKNWPKCLAVISIAVFPPRKLQSYKPLWAKHTTCATKTLCLQDALGATYRLYGSHFNCCCDCRVCHERSRSSYRSSVVVVMNVIIGFSQEYRANRALEALLTLSVPKATVIRDGKQEVLDSKDLVPGDLVVSQLDIIEAILTGESIGTEKSIRTIRKRTRKIPLTDCKGSAFMTTVVSRGRGKGIVVRTGEFTEIGRISKAITSTKTEETPIQKKLHSLGKWLVLLAILLCILVIIIGIAHGRPGMDMFKVGMSLAVSVIPEGLVAVVTVTMALAVGRMAKRNAIVRKLPSVETLGSVTHICSDKTGTLTEGKMGASGLWTSDNSLFVFTHPRAGKDGHVDAVPRVPLSTALSNIPVHSGPSDSSENFEHCSKAISEAPTHLVVASMVSALCCNATIEKDPENESGFKSTGDPTEVALVAASQVAGFPKVYFESSVGLEKMGEYAFDSDRKIMSVLYGQKSEVSGATKFAPETAFILVKGAPEGVLHRCKTYLPPVQDNATNSSTAQGHGKAIGYLTDFPAEQLTDEYVNYISARSEFMAAQGLRVLALAIRKVTKTDAKRIIDTKKQSEAESELTFVGLIGLIDPPKAGVKESVEKCKRAGIKVIMITGDHITTAGAIAKQLGIIDEKNNRAMKGAELDLISEDALADLRPFPVVFARVSPDNKLKIVRALQSRLFSVAMTGDGVNDAPAIKKADVGIAMGIGGTEITKQAADIVLADDNFANIIEAVREGRQVFDNIKKFIVYLLSCNSAEIMLFLASAIINVDMPFTTIQILWANIIADIPPAMSLGVEPAEINILDRPPRIPGQGVLTLTTCLVIIFQGLVQSMATLAVYLCLAHWLELEYISTGWEAVAVAVVIQIILNELMKMVVRERMKYEVAAFSEDSHLRGLGR
ncbi:calcium ATPase [Rhizoclosmatium globosum]|uniref:Calcium ATPase n=1 Tax=Rhizoclosmatium globosum TaxID=329046 RepID=A0A1Y2C9Q3_9FUNG|nr:calcium ATPase [Rhizoclosmatium globosum]|eukprot:ORY43768.1 calcium ATPase [Rhizoclosmatium globosum]